MASLRPRPHATCLACGVPSGGRWIRAAVRLPPAAVGRLLAPGKEMLCLGRPSTPRRLRLPRTPGLGTAVSGLPRGFACAGRRHRESRSWPFGSGDLHPRACGVRVLRSRLGLSPSVPMDAAGLSPPSAMEAGLSGTELPGAPVAACPSPGHTPEGRLRVFDDSVPRLSRHSRRVPTAPHWRGPGGGAAVSAGPTASQKGSEGPSGASVTCLSPLLGRGADHRCRHGPFRPEWAWGCAGPRRSAVRAGSRKASA